MMPRRLEVLITSEGTNRLYSTQVMHVHPLSTLFIFITFIT